MSDDKLCFMNDCGFSCGTGRVFRVIYVSICFSARLWGSGFYDILVEVAFVRCKVHESWFRY